SSRNPGETEIIVGCGALWRSELRSHGWKRRGVDAFAQCVVHSVVVGDRPMGRENREAAVAIYLFDRV
ncbi:MAG: hypothetical protein WCO89_04760, partial [Syntrophus sp. (in: bacteria)]